MRRAQGLSGGVPRNADRVRVGITLQDGCDMPDRPGLSKGRESPMGLLEAVLFDVPPPRSRRGKGRTWAVSGRSIWRPRSTSSRGRIVRWMRSGDEVVG